MGVGAEECEGERLIALVLSEVEGDAADHAPERVGALEEALDRVRVLDEVLVEFSPKSLEERAGHVLGTRAERRPSGGGLEVIRGRRWGGGALVADVLAKDREKVACERLPERERGGQLIVAGDLGRKSDQPRGGRCTERTRDFERELEFPCGVCREQESAGGQHLQVVKQQLHWRRGTECRSF